MARADGLRGRSVESLAAEWGVRLGNAASKTKGTVGVLVERALGATAGSKATWDFPSLRIELKTVPVDEKGKPRESTFVCTVSLHDADRAEWETAWARAKLSRVLWVPVRVDSGGARTIGDSLLWSPSREQERVLAQDFDEILGRVGAGQIDTLTAHVGRWLQLRPKAAHSRVRTAAMGAEGELVGTVPRGFYLRATFTGAILSDPMALPDGRGVRAPRKDCS